MIVTAEPIPLHLLVNQKISYIEIFICNPALPKYLAANQPRILWLHLYSSGLSGWASCPIPPEYRHVDPLQWATVFTRWRGLSLAKCLESVRLHDHCWDFIRKGLAASALLDMHESTGEDNMLKQQELIHEAQSYCYYTIN
jgi:hypothetical protein